MGAFTKSISFSAQVDSKGRITVPAGIRDRLDLEKGDTISLNLKSGKVIRKKFRSKQDALNYISELENVQSFSYNNSVLEVVVGGF